MDERGHETLTKARALLARPEHWTQGALARFAPHGYATDVRDPKAKCFCVIGACLRSHHEEVNDPSWVLPLTTALIGWPTMDTALLSDFNDDLETRHADVLALFDKAIANG